MLSFVLSMIDKGRQLFLAGGTPLLWPLKLWSRLPERSIRLGRCSWLGQLKDSKELRRQTAQKAHDVTQMREIFATDSHQKGSFLGRRAL